MIRVTFVLMFCWVILFIYTLDLTPLRIRLNKTILVTGVTGSGKSSLCNLLCNTAVFKSKNSANSITKSPQIAYCGDYDIVVIDTQGLSDTDTKHSFHTNDNPVDVILFVIKMDRFTNREYAAF